MLVAFEVFTRWTVVAQFMASFAKGVRPAEAAKFDQAALMYHF